MSSIKATQLRPGMVILHENELYTVFSTDHRTPGNKRGSMQTRLKSLRTGTMIDYRFRAEEFVERAILDEIEFESIGVLSCVSSISFNPFTLPSTITNAFYSECHSTVTSNNGTS